MSDYPLAIEWKGDHGGALHLLDQTELPGRELVLECRDVETVWEAIKMLRVRGAPAIGVSAAYGLVIGVRQHQPTTAPEAQRVVKEVADYLRGSRPTAVNLFWAMDRMTALADKALVDWSGLENLLVRLLTEAHAIREEDRQMCIAIGKHGMSLLPEGAGVLTHCNTGALATADFGTALSVLFHAHAGGNPIHVWVDETRPLLQGSRLTAWELMARGVPCTLICDNMAGVVMKQGKVQAAIVGADRIAANGDAANKIGTYTVALLCAAHKIPFYVAAPSTTFDFALADGSGIPIEERKPEEVAAPFGRVTSPPGVAVYNPAFDVTPAELITAFVTEKGVLRAPYADSLKTLRENAG